MDKVVALLNSRKFMMYVVGLASIVGLNHSIPNSATASLAIALLTGVTQAAHAYQTVRTQPTVSVADVQKAVGSDG